MIFRNFRSIPSSMKIKLNIDHKEFTVDLDAGIDISIPLSTDPKHTSAWYVEPMVIEPVRTEQFLGSVAEGGAVNFRNIFFNPHGHGTHTECVGHIDKTVHSVNQALSSFHSFAALMSVEPEILKTDREWMEGGDLVIGPSFLNSFPSALGIESLVIRTLPNGEDKLHKNYSSSNPIYLLPETMEKIVELGINHLLIDLPSVDRENDNGILKCHHLFWEHPQNTKYQKTITEFVFIPNEVPDAVYFMELQVAPIENDASPSRPVLYALS